MARTENEQRNPIFMCKPHKGKSGIVGKKWNRTKRRLSPYVNKRRDYGKFTFYDGGDVQHCYKTKGMKLELKNTNRSFKKSVRQRAKKEIAQILTEQT